jgi:hypothetical protein
MSAPAAIDPPSSPETLAPRRPRLWTFLWLAGGVLGLSILVTAGLTVAQASGLSRAPAASAASWLFFAGVAVLLCTQAMRERMGSGLWCLRGCFLILFLASPLVWNSVEMRVFALCTSGLWLGLSFWAAPRCERRPAPQSDSDATAAEDRSAA